MTLKHTPGPWFRLTGGDDTHISTSVGSDWMRKRVAKIWTADEADEILMAAAPDLLSALMAVVAKFDDGKEAWRVDTDEISLARSAISKATGA